MVVEMRRKMIIWYSDDFDDDDDDWLPEALMGNPRPLRETGKPWPVINKDVQINQLIRKQKQRYLPQANWKTETFTTIEKQNQKYSPLRKQKQHYSSQSEDKLSYI